MRKRVRILAYTLVVAVLSAAGATRIEAQQIAFEPAVEAIANAVILPGYARLSDSAARMDQTMTALCATPGAATLTDARSAFRELVIRWSRVEMFRFGPVRQDNRYERLFFWPDRKGLGLRQVRRILGEQDQTATTVDSLRKKSVAVQGLLALEYVLFGTGYEDLSAPASGTFRCQYGDTIAGAIALTARAVLDDWERDGGYADLMRDAGPDDPIYRSHGEVIQQILKSTREQLELVRNLKIARPLGKSAKAANPKAAPFWRSNAVVDSVNANLDSIGAALETGGIAALLPESDAWLVPSLAFELDQAQAAIAAAGNGPWVDTIHKEAIYQRLTYALIPLDGAHGILEDRLPASLGLITGFNSLDGD